MLCSCILFQSKESKFKQTHLTDELWKQFLFLPERKSIDTGGRKVVGGKACEFPAVKPSSNKWNSHSQKKTSYKALFNADFLARNTKKGKQ